MFVLVSSEKMDLSECCALRVGRVFSDHRWPSRNGGHTTCRWWARTCVSCPTGCTVRGDQDPSRALLCIESHFRAPLRWASRWWVLLHSSCVSLLKAEFNYTRKPLKLYALNLMLTWNWLGFQSSSSKEYFVWPNCLFCTQVNATGCTRRNADLVTCWFFKNLQSIFIINLLFF